VKREEGLPAKVEKLYLKEEKIPAKRKVVIKKEVSIETPNYRAVFTSEDARLKHFKLKKFEDRVEESSLTISLIRFIKGLLGSKVEEQKKPMPLDLVNTREEEGLPLGLSLSPFPSDGKWEVDREKLNLFNKGEKGEIIFSRGFENGLRVSKKFGFTSDKYAIDLEVEVQNTSPKEVQVQLGLGWIGKVELEKLADDLNKDYGLKYAYLKNEKIEKKALGGSGRSGCTPGCGPQKRTIDPFEFSEKGEIGWYSFQGEYDPSSSV
jgi:YidC/Oxa1 family membrane protein insertase